jgi:hypothetical protein
LQLEESSGVFTIPNEVNHEAKCYGMGMRFYNRVSTALMSATAVAPGLAQVGKMMLVCRIMLSEIPARVAIPSGIAIPSRFAIPSA